MQAPMLEPHRHHPENSRPKLMKIENECKKIHTPEKQGKTHIAVRIKCVSTGGGHRLGSCNYLRPREVRSGKVCTHRQRGTVVACVCALARREARARVGWRELGASGRTWPRLGMTVRRSVNLSIAHAPHTDSYCQPHRK